VRPFDWYDLAVLAMLAAPFLALVIVFLIFTARYAYLGWRLTTWCGSYSAAIEVAHAMRVARDEYDEQQMLRAMHAANRLRLIKR